MLVTRILKSLFARDVVAVAQELIGATLLVAEVGGRIVETEAYAANDPASLAHAGPKKKTESRVDCCITPRGITR